ncbi:MAG: Flp pilus assembly complex ATPase component TadA [Candidatus Omnitrophica bacterium]|nr:Flp pilus assembly complex ATPase component TadA [Candidatus Omnitrophota bacterium]
MVKSLKERLSQVLVKNGVVTQKALDEAVKIQKAEGGSISEILIKKGLVKEDVLVACLGEELDIPPINLSRYRISQELISMIPARVARHYQVLPISKIGDTLTVAMADPLNVFALDDLRVITGCQIKPIIGIPSQILESIHQYYEAPERMEELLEKDKSDLGEMKVVEDEGEEKIDSSLSDSDQAPVIRIVNLILMEALKQRASDVHLEPYEKRLRVRFRVDGRLIDAYTPPKVAQSAITTRLKIMSNLNIADRRQPQDGRFKIRLANREVDFRVSVLPVMHGEKVVLRALDKANIKVSLEELGFLPGPLKALEEAIKKPYGMILMTGPTGSGKSTTLYSVLNRLNTPDRNIITVEDPVEYQVEGITQIPINTDIGLTFASGLRSILRQSPDVVLVGEIRDAETADIAIKASLTGQLVFSTLHTNSAAGAIARLMDMGVEPFLISASLVLVAAQRLCRRVCPSCSEPEEVPREVLERVGLDFSKKDKPVFYRGSGCARCSETGYRGRMGTLETLTIDDEIRRMIVARASEDEILRYARTQGMRSLRENALESFKLGMTTLEEVLSVTGEE